MEHLQYVIEDSTIAYLLGVNNFTNDESAILELVKNSYDAGALHVNISFSGDQLVIADDGQGMDENNIRTAWMHVGKSDKSYEIFDANNRKRVLAGSKGVGRFALARLGNHVMIQTKKDSNYMQISLQFTLGTLSPGRQMLRRRFIADSLRGNE